MKAFGRIYRAIVEPDDPKGFVAILPAIPGLVAHSDSEEAVGLLRDLLRNHLVRLARRQHRDKPQRAQRTLRKTSEFSVSSVVDQDCVG